MALAEALKGNTTLKKLESAALPSNPPTPYGPTACTFTPHRPFSPAFAVCAASTATSSAPRRAWRSPRRSRATRPSRRSSLLPCHLEPTRPCAKAPTARTLAAPALFTLLCRVHSLYKNGLGPAAGMALAEVLKGNTTLTSLKSAALPSQTHSPMRQGRNSMHARCTRPFHFISPIAQPRLQRPRPRGWHGVRRGPQGQHDPHVAHVC